MKCLEPWCRLSPAISPLVFRTNFQINPGISFKLVKKVRPWECKATRRTSGGEEEYLERELFVFMKNSRNPDEFPTRKQLLDAGRIDLVNAISNTGGWLALGWDCDCDCDYSSQDGDNNDLDRQKLEMLPEEEEEEEEEDRGVEGILNRLEKHRSLSFDIIHMEKNKHASSNMPTDVVAAAKIDNSERRNKDLSPDKMRSRLEHMQLELSSAIHSLRSKSPTLNPEVYESCGSGSELQQLSDVWEFQENEVIRAGDKLRSMRAKLAVLQGKIALSLMDTHKLVEEKQRRIDSARATLQLLRTTCVFWSHSASEVVLVGSFDGWTSKVKMEKTRAGVFCASLKLYPGRYEIKFIVDGIWRVDPMLPVVHNGGYENNILVVHESA